MRFFSEPATEARSTSAGLSFRRSSGASRGWPCASFSDNCRRLASSAIDTQLPMKSLCSNWPPAAPSMALMPPQCAWPSTMM